MNIEPIPDATFKWLEFCSKYIFGFDEFQNSTLCMAVAEANTCLNKDKEKVASSGKNLSDDEFRVALTNWVKAMTLARAEIIGQITGFVSNREINSAFDTGCGFCAIPLFLQNQGYIKGQIIGIDILKDMILPAKELSKKCNGNADMLLLNSGDKKFSKRYKDHFDLVTCFDGITEMDCIEPTLAQIATVCKPGGVVVFTNPIDGNNNDYYVDHIKKYGEFHYLRGFELAGRRYTYALEKAY